MFSLLLFKTCISNQKLILIHSINDYQKNLVLFLVTQMMKMPKVWAFSKARLKISASRQVWHGKDPYPLGAGNSEPIKSPNFTALHRQ